MNAVTPISPVELISMLQNLAIAVPQYAPNFSDTNTTEIFAKILLGLNWSKQTWTIVFDIATRECETFPPPARLIKIATGADKVDSKSLATMAAEGIWRTIECCSPYSQPAQFMASLSKLQRLAVPSASCVVNLLEDQKSTQIAQWRDIMAGYIEANPADKEILQLRQRLHKEPIPALNPSNAGLLK